MSDLLKKIGDLSPAKRELLARRLNKGAVVPRQTQQIRPRGAAGLPSPLSFAQERLWFIAQLDEETPTHNVTSAMVLEGQLNVTLLEQALGEIGRRHESLRTVFRVIEGRPAQVVLSPALPKLPFSDLSVLSEARRGAQVRRRIAEEARRKFDLARGPLMRALLLRLSPQSHVLVQCAHHVICDAWSSEVLMRELVALYEAFSSGHPSPLAELGLQYADFAEWQREWLQGGDRLEEHLSFWRRQLAGAPPALEMPADRPRPPIPSTLGGTEHFELPEHLASALRQYSRQRGATLFMTMLTAWQALLCRYSGQTDISIGVPTGGRAHVETEGLIGLFGNTLVMRGNLEGNPTFEEMLGSTRQTALDAFGYQQMPFERLVVELQPERSLARTPLFQVMFDLQKASPVVRKLGSIGLEQVEVERAVSEFDLSLAITEEERRLTGALDYRRDLYDAATIRRMIGHFRELVEAVVANPTKRLGEIELLTPREREQLLVEWSHTETPFPREQCIHELFNQQAARTPESVAVVDGERHLTYAELNRRADRLARGLRRRGVGPECVVGLHLGRSAEMVSAILGVLKAGGVYLPLDPSHPAERISYMTDDAGAMLVLTDEVLAARPTAGAIEVISLDDVEEDEPPDAARAGELPGDPLRPVRSRPESAAYIIYTSGSTGRPKGVCVRHRGLVNHACAVAMRYGLRPGDRLLQFASVGFDVLAEELFPTLSSGATVVVWPEGVPASPAEVLRFAERNELTVLNLPTPLWHDCVARMQSSGERLPASVRQLIAGSDTAQPGKLSAWREMVGDGVGWTNSYGLTETTITTTIYESAARTALPEAGSVPIGRPIPNSQVYVLSPCLQPVPVGVPGEIYVGGEGLARGYLNKPGATAERFVPHPFSFEPGARLFRTGDAARFMPDGVLEFLGRLDSQVKLRGFRIEPGEIEDALDQHPNVRASVVLLREDEPGEKRLVAYLVAATGETPHADELRRFLRLRLPEHMIPAAFVTLDSLPLTPSGKVNRKALPAPAGARPSLGQGYVAPQTGLESVVAEAWRKALRIEQVGIHDNFFDLGGHSLLMVQVQSALQDTLQRKVPMLDLFRYPTISELAKYLNEGKGAPEGPLDERAERVRDGKDRMKRQIKQRRQAVEILQ